MNLQSPVIILPVLNRPVLNQVYHVLNKSILKYQDETHPALNRSYNVSWFGTVQRCLIISHKEIYIYL